MLSWITTPRLIREEAYETFGDRFCSFDYSSSLRMHGSAKAARDNSNFSTSDSTRGRPDPDDSWKLAVQCNVHHPGRVSRFDCRQSTYDRYGNRWTQNAPQGGPAPQYSFNTNPSNNQNLQFLYDAAGNLMNDGFCSYTYDAEGNVVQVTGCSTATYYYNALNQRVRADQGSTSREYVYNLAGQRTSIWDGNTRSQIQGQYYWGARPVAFYAGGSLHFQHQDLLGTERVQTSYNGSNEASYASLPWGDAYSTNGTDDDPYHFALLDHDSESSTEHAQFRQYSSTQGRWMSPDPYDGSFHFGNPQSFNRYAYAANTPLSYIDPSGLNVMWHCYPACGGQGSPGSTTDPSFSFSPGGGGSVWASATTGGIITTTLTLYSGVSMLPNGNYGSTVYTTNLYSGFGSQASNSYGGAPSTTTCPPNCGFTMKVNVSTTSAVAAPATFCTTYPTVCTIGIDVSAVLRAIPPAAASLLLLNMQGDNTPADRCTQVRKQAIAACTESNIGKGPRFPFQDNSGAFYACVRQKMEAAGCPN